MTTPILPDFERLRYWQGQRLLARDFRDQLAVAEQMRWWHNRALHNIFGIRFGLKVSSDQAALKLGVSCGLAYDCFGRELVLQAPKEIPLPTFADKTPTRLTLLIRFKQTREFPDPAQNREVCRPQCCDGAHEEPEFEWKDSGCVELGDGVPIVELSWESTARLNELPQGFEIPESLKAKLRYDSRRALMIFTGVMTAEEEKALLELFASHEIASVAEELIERAHKAPALDFSRVRFARAFTRPRIGSGSTVPGDTPWEVWVEPIASRRKATSAPLGVQVTIDTSAAGFTETPCYFAWLQGPLWNRTNQQFFPVPLQHIDKERPQSFRFRMWMPALIMLFGRRVRFANINSIAQLLEQDARGFPVDFINFARQQSLYVCWMGIQELPEPECVAPAPCECKTHIED
jgi:hypothetical protein